MNKEWLTEQLQTKTVSQITKELGCGDSTVYRWIRKFGIQYKDKPPFQNKEWLINELQTKTIVQISMEQNVSTHTISRWCKRFEINTTYKPYRNKEWLIEQLQKHDGSIRAIARETGYCRYSISEWIKRHKIPMDSQKHSVYMLDEEYFNTIDTEEKAYFLGFLMADGYMHKDLSHLSLDIQSQDAYILNELKNQLKYTGNIRHQEIENKSDTDTINICSQKLCKSLIFHGIVPLKSGKEILPYTVPENLIKHFIRGFFDGDGHIGNNSLVWDICSLSRNILLSIKEYFEKILDIKEYKLIPYYGPKSTKTLYYYNIYGDSARKVIYHLYEDANLYLIRKYNKCVEYCPALQKCKGNNCSNSENILTSNVEDNSELNI